MAYKQPWYLANLSTSKSEHIRYVELLLGGDSFNIMVAKQYLFRTVWPLWIVMFVWFAVRNKFFFYMVTLPGLFWYGIFTYMIYPVWKMCNISPKAYIIFHIGVLIILKLLAIPFGYLVGALWTLCF